MTEEDKKLISKYMGWNPYPPECMGKTVFYCDETHGDIRWDANAAAICVKEMQKRGDWSNFLVWQRFDTEPLEQFIYHIAWLFNAENFFEAFVEWRKTK